MLRNDWREHTALSVNFESINRCSQCKHSLSLSPCPSKTWSFLSLPSMPDFNPIPGICTVKIQSLICHFLPLNIFFPSSCGKPGEKNLYVLHFLPQLCMNNRKYFHLYFSLPLLLYYQAPLICALACCLSEPSLGLFFPVLLGIVSTSLWCRENEVVNWWPQAFDLKFSSSNARVFFLSPLILKPQYISRSVIPKLVGIAMS